MTENYYIGKPILFAIDNRRASIGEIIDFFPTAQGTCYMIREVADTPTSDGWNYYKITEKQIVKINPTIHKPEMDKWISEHITDINAVFGRDVSNYVISMYDSLEKVKDEFDEYAENDKYCRKVLDKWIFLVC